MSSLLEYFDNNECSIMRRNQKHADGDVKQLIKFSLALWIICGRDVPIEKC